MVSQESGHVFTSPPAPSQDAPGSSPSLGGSATTAPFCGVLHSDMDTMSNAFSRRHTIWKQLLSLLDLFPYLRYPLFSPAYLAPATTRRKVMEALFQSNDVLGSKVMLCGGNGPGMAGGCCLSGCFSTLECSRM